jgi:hypothetical protein
VRPGQMHSGHTGLLPSGGDLKRPISLVRMAVGTSLARSDSTGWTVVRAKNLAHAITSRELQRMQLRAMLHRISLNESVCVDGKSTANNNQQQHSKNSIHCDVSYQ